MFLLLSTSGVGEYVKGLVREVDLTQLQSIELGCDALRGDDRDYRKRIQKEPFEYMNSLRLKSGHGIIVVIIRSSLIDTL